MQNSGEGNINEDLFRYLINFPNYEPISKQFSQRAQNYHLNNFLVNQSSGCKGKFLLL